MAYLFLVLGIINLPVLFFFYQGNGTQSDNNFAKLSLGNIGAPVVACADTTDNQLVLEGDSSKITLDEYKKYTELSIFCGIGSEIGDLILAGVPKSRDTKCKSLLRDFNGEKNIGSQLDATC